nr:MAG TPA: hypothetical protein [Bacteriophage sp.]
MRCYNKPQNSILERLKIKHIVKEIKMSLKRK